MTATEVAGQQVVAVEDVPTALNGRAKNHDKPMVFKQIVRLRLADGTVTYGCIHCDYTAATAQSVRPHLTKHNRRPDAKRPGRKPTNPAVPAIDPTTTIADLLAAKQQVDAYDHMFLQITADRDDWKRRALDAERRLRQFEREQEKRMSVFRQALAGLGGAA